MKDTGFSEVVDGVYISRVNPPGDSGWTLLLNLSCPA